MSTIRIPTSFNIDLEFQLPEFFRRLLSLIIDIVILYVYIRLAIWLFERIARSMSYSSESDQYDLVGYWSLLFLPVLCYHLVMEITMNGQSIGKKITGIKVVNENGGKPSISQFVIRWLLRDIWFLLLLIALISDTSNNASVFILIFVFAYFVADILMVIISKKSQRLGDLLAHTILIRTSTKSDINETVFREVSVDYKPQFAQIMQLSDKDINAIKNIIQNSKGRQTSFADRAAERIQNHLKIETKMSSLQFLEVLLNDYNYLSTK